MILCGKKDAFVFLEDIYSVCSVIYAQFGIMTGCENLSDFIRTWMRMLHQNFGFSFFN